jgi:hypothetical protein
MYGFVFVSCAYLVRPVEFLSFVMPLIHFMYLAVFSRYRRHRHKYATLLPVSLTISDI